MMHTADLAFTRFLLGGGAAAAARAAGPKEEPEAADAVKAEEAETGVVCWCGFFQLTCSTMAPPSNVNSPRRIFW